MLGRKWGLENTAYTGKIDKKKLPVTQRYYHFFKTEDFLGNIKILVGVLMLSQAIKWWDIAT